MAETATEEKVNLSTVPEGTDESDIVKPVALAKERDIRPQIVFGWIRNGGLNSYKNAEGKNVILRSELAAWETGRAEKKAEREQRKAEKEAKEKAKAEAGEGAETATGTEDATAEEVF